MKQMYIDMSIYVYMYVYDCLCGVYMYRDT